MNERIRELMIQTMVETGKLEDVQATYQRFAELIVRECYENCKGQILDKEVADTNELTYNDAVSDCANGLLQHFGVEE